MSSWYFVNCDVMSIYFYVTADKIYWILPYAQLEPGGEELFVWEKGKGLVEFGIGFGPGPLDVHIDEICEVTEDARVFWIEQSDRRVLQ